MRTNQAVSKRATENPIISVNNPTLALALISLGLFLIKLGPWLSGTSQTVGSWCHHGAAFSAHGLIQDLVWMASQHCGYCYLGAALVGIGMATGLRRPI